jgi:hypothetical protein
MALTDLKLKAAQPAARPYHLTDGHGLFVVVQQNESKIWRWKYRFQGEYRLMAFGSYPWGSLADARAAHAAARAQLFHGTDPMQARKAGREAERALNRREEPNTNAQNPFRVVATQWFEKWKAGKVERYVQDTETRIEQDVLSRIGNRPIADIKPPEIANMILAIEERGAADVARRALQNTQQIFRYAMAFGFTAQNPAAAFRPSDTLKQRSTTNFARIDVSELPTLLKKSNFTMAQISCVLHCS